MNAKNYLTQLLFVFGKLFQLSKPEAEYIEALYMALHNYGWTTADLKRVINELTRDEKYVEISRFGKYPTIADFVRVKHELDSKPFYDALRAYLSGDWWMKEEIWELATDEQKIAIEYNGGLTKLWERATDSTSKQIPVYKLIESVQKSEPVQDKDMFLRLPMLEKTDNIKQLTENNDA
jgi:hypothetical protein